MIDSPPAPVELEAGASADEVYVLKLYIAGATPRSTLAILNIRKICEGYFPGRHDLEIIDLSRFPALAAGEQIIATPTLIKQSPPPLRRFIGDISRAESILREFGARLPDSLFMPASRAAD